MNKLYLLNQSLIISLLWIDNYFFLYGQSLSIFLSENRRNCIDIFHFVFVPQVVSLPKRYFIIASCDSDNGSKIFDKNSI
jgi:hypothetical protein